MVERAIAAHGLDLVVFNQLFPMAHVSDSAGVRLVAHIDATFSGLLSLGGYLDSWSTAAVDSVIRHGHEIALSHLTAASRRAWKRVAAGVVKQLLDAGDEPLVTQATHSRFIVTPPTN